MGIFKKLRKSEDLAERGVPAKATIESLEMQNRGEFQLSTGKVEDMMSGEGTMITAKFKLRIEPSGGEPYTVSLEQPVPMMKWTRLGPSGVVAVLVDPDDKDHVEIDFDGEIVEPSLEQRAESDPVLRGLLDRRIDPPKES